MFCGGNVVPGNSSFIKVPEKHDGLIYLIKGSLVINDSEFLSEEGDRMFILGNDGNGFALKATAESEFLVLSGVPIKEPIVSHGPFVMNTAEEIKQAIHDFQKGKMGVSFRMKW